MPLSRSAYALLGLTAIVAALVAVVAFALLRFIAAARATRHRSREGGEMALLSAALQEAVAKLKAQERATAARADASERLSGEIITSLTAGLLVVGLNARDQDSESGRPPHAGSPEAPPLDDYRRVLAEPLAQMIDECLATRAAILRRTIRLQTPRARRIWA